MEVNGKIAKVEQLIENLPQLLPSTSDNSLSLYSGELTTLCVIENVKRLKAAFPALPQGFYDILVEMVKDDGFGDQRLTDAVKNVIKTCVYPIPTVANIISWDRRIKLYNYKDVCDYIDKGGRMDDFEKHEIKGKIFWINKKDQP